MMNLFWRFRYLLIAVILGAGVTVGSFSWYRSVYPYGRSHCCDKQLYLTLASFADTHDQQFPAGEATPEASLSLIHSMDEQGCAYLLCGKSGSESSTKEILDRGELLGPDSCGWNYVEGLRIDDDSRLALFWDKEGLGHNGQRLSGGGHIVTFIGGSSSHIRAASWDKFLAEQKALFAKRKNAVEEIGQ